MTKLNERKREMDMTNHAESHVEPPVLASAWKPTRREIIRKMAGFHWSVGREFTSTEVKMEIFGSLAGKNAAIGNALRLLHSHGVLSSEGKDKNHRRIFRVEREIPSVIREMVEKKTQSYADMIREWISSHSIGHEFTSTEIGRELGLDNSVVTGNLVTLVKSGAIELWRQERMENGRTRNIYRVLHAEATNGRVSYSGITRNRATGYSVVRAERVESEAVVASAIASPKLSEQLLDLAARVAEMEREAGVMKTKLARGLAEVPTEELMDEIRRRVR